MHFTVPVFGRSFGIAETGDGCDGGAETSGLVDGVGCAGCFTGFGFVPAGKADEDWAGARDDNCF